MGGVLAPRVDVAEDDKSVTLTAELPGVKEKRHRRVAGRRPAHHQGREALRARGQEGESRRPYAPPHGALLRRLPADADRSLPGRSRSRSRRSSGMAFSRSRCPSRPMRSRRSRVARSRSTGLPAARAEGSPPSRSHASESMLSSRRPAGSARRLLERGCRRWRGPAARPCSGSRHRSCAGCRR